MKRKKVFERWPDLPKHIKTAVNALVVTATSKE